MHGIEYESCAVLIERRRTHCRTTYSCSCQQYEPKTELLIGSIDANKNVNGSLSNLLIQPMCREIKCTDEKFARIAVFLLSSRFRFRYLTV